MYILGATGLWAIAAPWATKAVSLEWTLGKLLRNHTPVSMVVQIVSVSFSLHPALCNWLLLACGWLWAVPVCKQSSRPHQKRINQLTDESVSCKLHLACIDTKVGVMLET